MVATAHLLNQLESVIYCFYGYDDNYTFDWYIKYGSVLEPVPVDPTSQNPIISSLTANTSTLIPNNTTSITCNAYDPSSNPLKYYWSVTGGNISGSGPTVNWTAPSSGGTYTASCSISNGKSISSQNIDIEVIPLSTPSSSSPPTVNFLTISPQVLYPGDSFTITYNVTNPGSTINNAILGASIGPSGTSIWPISDTVNDVKVSIPSGTSNVSRTFTIPSYIYPGTYDLLVGLWQDVNNNNVIDTSIDTLLNSKANRPAITIWSTIPGTKPAPFTLSVTAECSGSSPENLLSWNASSGAIGYYAVYRCTGSNCTPTLYWQNATAVPNTTFRNTSVTIGTTYTYFVRASNSYGYTDSNWVTVITSSCSTGSPPTVTTNAATNITYNSATLNGTVNPNGLPTTVYFQYSATTTSWLITLSADAGSGTTASPWQATVSGLNSNSTFYFRIVATNSAGTTYGNTLSFTTLSSSTGSAPTATTGSATNITSNSATLNGSVNPNGLSTTVYFQYSAAPASGWISTGSVNAGSGTTASPWQATVSGLASNSTFYFRIVAANSAGTTYGSTLTFTTSGGTQQTERLINGGFASGTSGWTSVGDFWAGTNLDYTGRYRTYPGYAAGGVDSTGLPKNNASGYMYQTVTIPSGATSATLSFWLNITSDESTTITQYDKLFVEVLNSSGILLTTLATYSNLDKGPYCSPTCSYNQKSFNLTSYKGQTIRIQFRATTDSATDTVFRIDDVSLMSDG